MQKEMLYINKYLKHAEIHDYLVKEKKVETCTSLEI